MGKHLWCYRAHCMQAHTSQFDPISRRAVPRAGIELVLLSLPLLLLGSCRCGTPVWFT